MTTKGGDSLINLQRFKAGGLATNRTCPSRQLLLQLKKGWCIKALVMWAYDGSAWDLNSHCG